MAQLIPKQSGNWLHKIDLIFLFTIPMFLVYIADSALSFIFPIVVENSLNSNTLLGLVMAASSIAGLACDFLFPQLFTKRGWRFYALVGLTLAMFFPVLILLGDKSTFVGLFILASIIWGIYFEFIGFAQQEFIAKEQANVTRAWSILYTALSVPSIVGSILGSVLLRDSVQSSFQTIIIIQLIAILILFFIVWRHPAVSRVRPKSKIVESIKLFKELKYWNVIVRRVLPIMIMGIMSEVVEATYWTLGGLFGKDIADDSGGFDWLTIVLYSIPFIIGSILMVKLNIRKGKKRLSQLMLLVGGAVLMPISLLRGNTFMLYGVIMLSAFFFSFVGLLNVAVGSDLVKRLGKNSMHLIGLDQSTSSVAYIIGPVIMGFIADKSDYYVTFSMLGWFCVMCALFLLFTTPKKLKLPQVELNELSEG